MGKEEALKDFLQSFKVSLNIASLYPKTHPYFSKPVADVKEKIDALSAFVNPLKLGFADNYLVVDGFPKEVTATYSDLAKFFHQRKIKGLEIRQGADIEELVAFLAVACLHPREILKGGGILKMLQGANVNHIFLEELDYSLLLRMEGEDTKDIWLYLLQAAPEKNDSQVAEQISENSLKFFRQFKVNDLLQDSQSSDNLKKFIDYLRNSKMGKQLAKFTASLTRAILVDNEIPEEKKLDYLREFSQGLGNKDLADLLFDEVVENAAFEKLHFKVFARLFDTKKHEDIVSFLTQKKISGGSSQEIEKKRQRINQLFSLSDNSFVSQAYQKALVHMLDDLSTGEKLYFNRLHLTLNYRLLLLDLLSTEKEADSLSGVAQRLLKDWDKIMAEPDSGVLKTIVGLIVQRKRENPACSEILKELEEKTADCIEDIIIEKENIPEIDLYLASLKLGGKDTQYYIDKIFGQSRMSTDIIRLFFNFPNRTQLFCQNLKEKYSDFEFLSKAIASIKFFHSPIALEILKFIYIFSNSVIKLEVLNAMQDTDSFDEEFIISILERGDIFLKKKALAVLKKKSTANERILGILFPVPDFWGKNNAQLLESILIVEEVDYRGALPKIVILSKRRFFWNRKLRKKAREVLRKWVH